MSRYKAVSMRRRVIEGPHLMSSVPADGAAGVPTNTTVLLQFNKPMALTGFNLRKTSGIPASIAVTVTNPGGDLTKVLITQDFPPLLAHQTYELFDIGITDTQGKAIHPYGVPLPEFFT
jgi:hypothetical protein